MADWREQEASNETLSREMNEWTEEDTDSSMGLDRPIDTCVCECSDARCTEPIRLTRAEYEDVRSVAIRFAIAPPREPEIDLLVGENDRFATVDKFFGFGQRLARATNPRSVTALPM
jgi:hypothetical protein